MTMRSQLRSHEVEPFPQASHECRKSESAPSILLKAAYTGSFSDDIGHMRSFVCAAFLVAE